uniref:Uncharacterized protein n=1 Tax=Anguilla anguilla TaxID=7936 RepID=A0A0E9TPF5_ANGAN
MKTELETKGKRECESCDPLFGLP